MNFFTVCLILGVAVSTQGAIVRPCEPVSLKCVQKYLASVSSCTPVSKATGLDPYVHNGSLWVPNKFINTTAERYILHISGLLDSYVSDLYVNTETQQTVLRTHHPFYNQTGKVNIYYFLDGEPDLVVNTPFEFINELVNVTTIFKGVDSISLDKAEIRGYIYNVKKYDVKGKFPGLAAAAKIYQHVAEVRGIIDSNLAIKFREDISVVGPLVNNVYLNHAVCNFK